MTITRGTLLTISAICYDRPKMAHELTVFLAHSKNFEDALQTYFLHQKTRKSAQETLLNRLKSFNLDALESTLLEHKINIISYKIKINTT